MKRDTMQWMFAALVGAVVQVSAPARAAEPLQAVIDAGERLNRACVAAGGRPGNGAFLMQQDFTGDGRADYLVNAGNYECRGRPDALVEDGQGHVEIYVSDRNGNAVLAYRERLMAVRVLDGRPVAVQVAQRGGGCGPGSSASTECGGTLRWNARDHAFDLELTGVRANPRAPMQRPPAGTRIARAGQPQGAPPGASAGREPAPRAADGGTLPIEYGFYVREGVACSAVEWRPADPDPDIRLIGRRYMSFSDTNACDFTTVKLAGDKAYDVDMHCVHAMGGQEDRYDEHVRLRIESRTRIEIEATEHMGGNKARFRHCPQGQLPDPYRGNDIRDIVR